MLERIDTCRTIILDRLALTYGEPRLTERLSRWEATTSGAPAGGLGRYSKHPLAGPSFRAAEGSGCALDATEIREPPAGTRGTR
jgi:cation transport ATPase